MIDKFNKFNNLNENKSGDLLEMKMLLNLFKLCKEDIDKFRLAVESLIAEDVISEKNYREFCEEFDIKDVVKKPKKTKSVDTGCGGGSSSFTGCGGSSSFTGCDYTPPKKKKNTGCGGGYSSSTSCGGSSNNYC